MLKTLKFLLALVVAFGLMLCFRAVVLTVYTIDGNGLEPLLVKGDRVLVNRWSYGLRVGTTGGLFSYGRIGKRLPQRGDIVAFENPRDNTQILVCRCAALPGDSIIMGTQAIEVPGVANCANADYYWMEAIGNSNATDSRQLGFIAEELIIGRVIMILYSHNTQEPFWKGWRRNRFLLPM